MDDEDEQELDRTMGQSDPGADLDQEQPDQPVNYGPTDEQLWGRDDDEQPQQQQPQAIPTSMPTGPQDQLYRQQPAQQPSQQPSQIGPGQGGYANPYAPGAPAVGAKAAPRDFRPAGETQFVGGPPAPPKPKTSFGSDFYEGVKATAKETGADIFGAARWAADYFEQPGVADWLGRQRDALTESVKTNLDAMSPGQRKAYESSFAQLLTGEKSIEESGGVLEYTKALVSSTAPMLLLGYLRAPFLAKGLFAAAKTLNASEGVAAGVGTAARVAQTGSVFGAVQAGAFFNTIEKEIDTATPEVLMQQPKFAQDVRNGMTIEQAKTQLKHDVAGVVRMGEQFGLGFAGGVAMREVLPGGGPRILQPTTRGGGAAVGAAEVGGSMAAQGGGGNLVTQQAEVQAGLRPEVNKGQVAAAAGASALGGILLGGTGGFARQPHEAPAVKSDTDTTTTTTTAGRPDTTPAETSQPHPSPENTAALAAAMPKPAPEAQAALAQAREQVGRPPAEGQPPGGGQPPLELRMDQVARPPLGPESVRAIPTSGDIASNATDVDRAVAMIRQFPRDPDGTRIQAARIYGAEAAQAAAHIVDGSRPSDPRLAAQVDAARSREAGRQMPSGQSEVGLEQRPPPYVDPNSPAAIYGRTGAESPIGGAGPPPREYGTPRVPERAQAIPTDVAPGQGDLLRTTGQTRLAEPRGYPLSPTESQLRTATIPVQRRLPPPTDRSRGDGFTIVPEGTPVPRLALGSDMVPVERRLPAPPVRGEGFTIVPVTEGKPPTVGDNLKQRAAEKGEPPSKPEQQPGQAPIEPVPTVGEDSRAATTPTVGAEEPPPTTALVKKETMDERIKRQRAARLKGDQERKKARENFVAGAVETEGPQAQKVFVVDEKEQAIEPVQPMEPVPVPKSSPTVTDLKSISRNVMDRMLDDGNNLSLDDALKEYNNEAGGPGRPRRVELADLRTAMGEEIDRLNRVITGIDRMENPTEEQLTQQSTDTTRRDGLLEKVAEHEGLKLEEQERHKAAGEKLRDAYAARQREQANKGQRDLPAAAVSPLRQVFDNEAVNRPVRDLFTRLSDGAVRLQDFLSNITGSRDVQRASPAAVLLARRLSGMLPHDVQVYDQETAQRLFANSSASFIRPDVLGSYYTGVGDHPPFIVLNKNHANTGIEAVLHETYHAVTEPFFNKLPSDAREFRVLEAIANEMRPAVDTVDNNGALQYALTDPRELITLANTNPRFREIASELVPSPGFRAELAKLGYGPGKFKSMWQALTRFIRQAVGLPRQTESLLDHIMRPINDITESARRFNTDALPRDPVLREQAIQHLDAVSASGLGRRDLVDLSEGYKTARAFTEGTTPGMWRRLRAVALQFGTGQGIESIFRRAMTDEQGRDLMRMNRDAIENEGRAKAKFYRDYTDDVNRIARGIATSARDKEGRNVGDLARDATLANVRLGPGADNSHVKGDNLQRLPDLQARYNAMRPEDQRTYNEFRDLERKWYDQSRSAWLRGVARLAVPDITDAQLQGLADQLRTRRGINQLIDNPDGSAVAKTFGESWQRNQQLVRLIGRGYGHGFIEGDYFPLARWGDYVVTYGKDDMRGTEFFESHREAFTARAELVKNKEIDVSQIMSKRASHMRDMVASDRVMKELTDEVATRFGIDSDDPMIRDRAKNISDQVRDMYASILLEHSAASEARASRMRRHNIRGASVDMGRALGRDMLSMAHKIAYYEHGPKRIETLDMMRRHVERVERTSDKPGEAMAARAVLEETELRDPRTDDNSSQWTKHGAVVNQLSFVHSLLSVSQGIVNAVETHMNSTAILGSEQGYGRAMLALGKALADAAPTVGRGAKAMIEAVGHELSHNDWLYADVLRDRYVKTGANKGHMTKLFDELSLLLDHSQQREIQQLATNRLARTNPFTRGAQRAWNQFNDFSSILSHASDAINKGAVGKAAFDLAYSSKKLRGLDEAERVRLAIDYASEKVRQVAPNYGPGGKSRFATPQGVLGPLGPIVSQFKNYGLHMYSMLGAMVHQMVKGATPEERRNAAKAFAGILVTHAMFAGAMTWVADPLRYIGGAYDFITGAKRPHDYQADWRGYISDVMGPTWGEIFARGIPHAIGIDIHHRVGLNNMLNVPEWKSFDKEGFGLAIGTMMIGAPGENAGDVAGGLSSMLQGDLMKGAQALIPRNVRDIMKAYQRQTEGVTDSRGNVIMPASRLSGLDVLYQAIGFQPSAVSEFREGHSSGIETRQEVLDQHSKLIQRWVTADPREKSAVLRDDIQPYNRKNPDEQISYSQLNAAVRRQQLRLDPQTSGLVVSPRLRQRIIESGRFANVPR